MSSDRPHDCNKVELKISGTSVHKTLFILFEGREEYENKN